MLCTSNPKDRLAYANEALSLVPNHDLSCDFADAAARHLRAQIAGGDQLVGDLLVIQRRAGFLPPDHGKERKQIALFQMISDGLGGRAPMARRQCGG